MTRPDFKIRSQKTVGKRIVKNTGLLVGAKALTAFIGLATLIITERALDNQVAFGTIVFLHAYMLFFAEVATFQSWQSLIRFGTDDLKSQNEHALSKLIRFGISLDFLSAIGAFLTAIGLFGFVTYVMTRFPDVFPQSEVIDPNTLRNLVFFYCTVVLAKQTGTAIGVLRLFDKFKGLALCQLVMPITRLTGAIIAYKSGWGMIGFIAVWYIAALMGYLALIALGVSELVRRNFIRPILNAKTDFKKPRTGLWSFVWKSNIDSTLAAGTSHLPLLLVMSVFGPAFVAVYKIAEEIAKFLSEGVRLLDQVIYPELARIMSEGGADRIWRLVAKAGIASLGVGLVLSILTSLSGPFIIENTLGQEYGQAVILAILLLFGAALFAAVAPLYPVFYAADKPERAIYCRVAELIIYVSAFFLLTKGLGEWGAAWAVIASYFAGVIIVTLLVRTTLRQAIAKSDLKPVDEVP